MTFQTKMHDKKKRAKFIVPIVFLLGIFSCSVLYVYLKGGMAFSQSLKQYALLFSYLIIMGLISTILAYVYFAVDRAIKKRQKKGKLLIPGIREYPLSNKNDKASIENNVKSLNEIAGKYGKRTTSVNLIDPQVGRIPYDWKDVFSDKDKPIPPDCFIRKVSYKVDDYKIMLCVNDEYLVARIEGAFDNSVICSFVNNQVHDPGKHASKALCKDYGFEVFVNSSYEESTISFLQNPSFKNYINLLRLSPKESLHIGNGWASLYLQRFKCDDVLDTLDILYQLLSLIPPAKETPINFEGLPEKFKTLLPGIKRWAIPDDNDRSEKLAKASSKTLTQLVKTVSPYFTEINQYLDSFGNRPLPEHAILLGTLAECATEAQLILKARE
jgi:hypothetical protein